MTRAYNRPPTRRPITPEILHHIETIGESLSALEDLIEALDVLATAAIANACAGDHSAAILRIVIYAGDCAEAARMEHGRLSIALAKPKGGKR
jgi:hypothetical protein